MDPHAVLIRPMSTEKAIRAMQSDNKLMFVVHKKATKKDIKTAFETVFRAKVMRVNTLVAPSGEKHAIIKLGAEKSALDIATQLGLM